MPALAVFAASRKTQELPPPLKLLPGDVMVTKQYPSAFFGNSLDATLRHLKIDTLLLAGLTTSGCVRASSIDAISLGYVTLVVSDASGDRALPRTRPICSTCPPNTPIC